MPWEHVHEHEGSGSSHCGSLSKTSPHPVRGDPRKVFGTKPSSLGLHPVPECNGVKSWLFRSDATTSELRELRGQSSVFRLSPNSENRGLWNWVCAFWVTSGFTMTVACFVQRRGGSTTGACLNFMKHVSPFQDFQAWGMTTL